jgi:hypothetical protein
MTLQDQYTQINEGKGAKDVFLKHAKKLFPNMIPNHYGYDDSIKILKQRSIITENIWGIANASNKQPDWFKIFNESINEYSEASNWENEDHDIEDEELDYNNISDLEDELRRLIRFSNQYGSSGADAKIEQLKQRITQLKNPINEAKTYTPSSQEVDVKSKSTKTAKEVEVKYDKKYDNTDTKKADNVIFDQLIRGVQFEMENSKNADKTVEEIKNIVLKNLTKDPIWYTKNAMFGVEGLGYTNDAVALKLSKTDQMVPVSKDKVKANVKDGKTENKKGMPKKVDQMTSTAKSSKGVQKMATPGKPKTIKLKN